MNKVMPKPSRLRKGQKVRRTGEANAPVLTFVERDELGRRSVMQCDEYKGLSGPDDQGFVVISDWDMPRKYELVQ
jgi:hypothetical protein